MRIPWLAAGVICLLPSLAAAETWRGLEVAPEYRCARYNAKAYRYPQSVEPKIIAQMGKIFSPYTGECFDNRRQTDIEHIVARSEAHDSGLCGASAATKKAFSADLLNLTLASPRLNRGEKGAKDAADWVPKLNRCWFAHRVVEVRRKYQLTIDRREARALEKILSQCDSAKMKVVTCQSRVEASPRKKTRKSGGDSEALRRWDDDGNGRITCREARRHGIAPVPRSHPAYPYMRDGDGDGVVCE